MDFQPRRIINGRMLKECLNQPCSILLNIEDVDGPGQLAGRSTDGVAVRVRCTKSDERISARGWMEIIGRPTGAGEMQATDVIVFESQPADGAGAGGEVEPFDTDAHNMLVQFLKNKPADELYVAK